MAARQKSKYNAYRYKDEIGPGPEGVRTQKRDEWDCECHVEGREQVCECKRVKTRKGKASKQVKIVRNDLKKKKVYRKKYKRWLEQQRRLGKR